MLSNQIRAVFAGRFCLRDGEGRKEEREREKSDERKSSSIHSPETRRERFRGREGEEIRRRIFEIREEFWRGLSAR